MRRYRLESWGMENLHIEDAAVAEPGVGDVRVAIKAASLNFRDLMVIRGVYNPKLPLPATPLSDGAGVVTAVGDGVERWEVGDQVVSHFISAWHSGAFRGEYVGSTLGMPQAGVAAEEVILPADALVPLPAGYDFTHASTLPIAALTAWSALVTEGGVESGDTVLTLGTGGVSIFAVQLAKARGARVIITSSSDEKLARAKQLGADHGVNYRTHPDWEKEILKLTDGAGADVTVENGGAGTLNQSMRATRAGGTIAMLGALTGLRAELDIAPVLMKRLRILGVMVDSRDAFEHMNRFLASNRIEPVIDRTFKFDQLPDALRHMEAGAHFGKIVIEFDE